MTTTTGKIDTMYTYTHMKMEAYDKLPPSVRDILKEDAGHFSPIQIFHEYKYLCGLNTPEEAEKELLANMGIL
jgi:hypothetical protein